MAMGSKWIALALLVACSKEEPKGTNAEAPSADGQLAALVRHPSRNEQADDEARLAKLTAEELVGLKERRSEGYELTEDETAVLDEYDDLLARIMSGADAANPSTNETRPCIVTRDYELWISPGKEAQRYTVKDRAGKVLAERVDEDRLRRDFSYLQNLLHPEYLQFYDTVDDVDY
jgi:hypothetical protein